eukprot:COSAG04_NODE_1033_length_8611_cov_5.832942_2_plen_54_part_00
MSRAGVVALLVRAQPLSWKRARSSEPDALPSRCVESLWAAIAPEQSSRAREAL